MKTIQNCEAELFNRFDKLFNDIYENISNGWRAFPVDDFHVAVIVYQRILLECMDATEGSDDDSLFPIRKLKQVKLWITGYI